MASMTTPPPASLAPAPKPQPLPPPSPSPSATSPVAPVRSVSTKFVSTSTTDDTDTDDTPPTTSTATQQHSIHNSPSPTPSDSHPVSLSPYLLSNYSAAKVPDRQRSSHDLESNSPRRPRRAYSHSHSHQQQQPQNKNKANAKKFHHPSTPATSKRNSHSNASIANSARDEIEEQFMNRASIDGESTIISAALDAVHFRQLTDDEEVLSDEDEDEDDDDDDDDIDIDEDDDDDVNNSESKRRRKKSSRAARRNNIYDHSLRHNSLLAYNSQQNEHNKPQHPRRRPPSISEDDVNAARRNTNGMQPRFRPSINHNHNNNSNNSNENGDVDVNSGVQDGDIDTDSGSDDFDPEFQGIDLHRDSSSSVLLSSYLFRRPNSLPHSSSAAAASAAAGAQARRDELTRALAENRRLQRQIDELEFELASHSLKQSSSGNDIYTNGNSNNNNNAAFGGAMADEDPFVDDHLMYLDHGMMTQPGMSKVSSSSILPPLKPKRKSWTSRILKAGPLSASSAKVSSEREMLRSQVQALTVTTEYLWRKLNKAELELRQYRLKQIRSSMRIKQQQQQQQQQQQDKQQQQQRQHSQNQVLPKSNGNRSATHIPQPPAIYNGTLYNHHQRRSSTSRFDL